MQFPKIYASEKANFVKCTVMIAGVTFNFSIRSPWSGQSKKRIDFYSRLTILDCLLLIWTTIFIV